MIFQRYLPQYQKDDSHVLFSRQLVEWNYIIVLDIKGKFVGLLKIAFQRRLVLKIDGNN